MVDFIHDERWTPEHVREYLRALRFIALPPEALEPYISSCHERMRTTDKDTDGVGRMYKAHRRSIHPAMRVCQDWGPLLLNDKTQAVCDCQECTDWLATYLAETGFMPAAQAKVVQAFGMGTGRGRCGWTRMRVRPASGTTTHGWWFRSPGTRRKSPNARS